MSKDKLLRFWYLWASNNTHKQLMRAVGLSPVTVTDWMSYTREMIAEVVRTIPTYHVIGGPGIIVEIDESKFGKRNANRGKRVPGMWVFGGVEHILNQETGLWHAGKMFAVCVDNRSAATLEPLIERHIARGSVIYSDLWRAYNNIDQLPEMNYSHQTVNHSEGFTNPEDGTCVSTLPSI
jgi:IS1 family transposase